jgi:hypothetical protein
LIPLDAQSGLRTFLLVEYSFTIWLLQSRDPVLRRPIPYEAHLVDIRRIGMPP